MGVQAAKMLYVKFQHTAARRRLLLLYGIPYNDGEVSTHSRPKAAALFEMFE